MIITLARSFSGLDQSEWLPYIGAVENLIKAHLQGWHFFVPDRASAAAIAASPALSASALEAFQIFIVERLSVLQGYAETADIVLAAEQIGEHGVSQQKELRVPLNIFADLENCLKSKIIVENVETDATFYISVAQEALAIGSLVPALALEKVAGGGHTTSHRVAEAVKEYRPSVTIVDGDRTHPSAPEGATARAVRLAYARDNTQTHCMFVTQVRAIENFIPFCVGSYTLSDGAAKRRAALFASWQSGEAPAAQSADDFLTAFYGAKKGLRIKAFRTGGANFQAMVKSLCEHLGETFTAPDPYDSSNDNDYAIVPLSKDYASLFMEHLVGGRLSTAINDLRQGPFFEELRSIAAVVAAFGAAPLKSVNRLSG